MGKVPDTFEKFEWPWKKGEVDEERVAKLVWNARRDEEAAEVKAQEQRDKVTQLQTKLDAAEAAKSGTDEEGQQKIKDLTKQVRDLEAAKTELTTAKAKLETDGRPEDKLELDRMTVALELGLSARDAKRLVGKDRDELLDDAKAFAKEHGIELAGDEDDGDDDGDDGDNNLGKPPVREPALNLRTGAGAGKVKVASDTAAAAKDLPPLW